MRTRGSPTVETLVLIGIMFLIQQVAWFAGLTGLFALSVDVAMRPWTLVTSVYAHAGVVHLVTNAIGLAILGPLVAYRTTRGKFHAFFLTTGILAGVAQVGIGSLLGPPHAVIGASGAIFALLGYLLSGNVVSSWLLEKLSLPPRLQLIVFLLIAVLITLATASPQSALIGHGAGLLMGLIAGRLRLRDNQPAPSDPEPQEVI